MTRLFLADLSARGRRVTFRGCSSHRTEKCVLSIANFSSFTLFVVITIRDEHDIIKHAAPDLRSLLGPLPASAAVLLPAMQKVAQQSDPFAPNVGIHGRN